jgi:hypothetical protein
MAGHELTDTDGQPFAVQMGRDALKNGTADTDYNG